MSEYLLFEPHPASTMLYTPSEVMPRKNSRPTFASDTLIVCVIGTTAKARSTVTTNIPGATTYTSRSANGGIQSSFMKSLMMSAIGCSRPNGPTRFGPSLS